MKLTYLIIFVGMFLIMGCDPIIQDAKCDNQRQESANEIVKGITYIRDPRTGFCFAYYWGGMGNGGPALTLVPTNTIPTNLIVTATIK
jgi:hypothetical protein